MQFFFKLKNFLLNCMCTHAYLQMKQKTTHNKFILRLSLGTTSAPTRVFWSVTDNVMFWTEVNMSVFHKCSSDKDNDRIIIILYAHIIISTSVLMLYLCMRIRAALGGRHCLLREENIPQPRHYQHHFLFPEGQKRMSHDSYKQKYKPPSVYPIKASWELCIFEHLHHSLSI